MNCDHHDVLFDGSHPLPSNYRAYRQSVPARLVKILRQKPLSRDRRRPYVRAGAVQGYQRPRHPVCRVGLRTCLRRTPGRDRHRRSKHRLSGKCVRNIPFQPDQVGEKSRDFRHHLSRRELFNLCRFGGRDCSSAVVEAWHLVPFRWCEVLLRKKTFDSDHNSICGCRRERAVDRGQRTSRHDHTPRLSDPVVQL